MKMLLLACLLATVAVTHVACQNDTTAQGANVYLKVLGHSGKIMVGWQKDVEKDDRRVVIDFDGLQELDGSLRVLKQQGHSFKSFATQDFNFSSLQDGTIGSSSTRTSFFTFSCQLKGLSSTVIVTVYIIHENGSITLGDETTPLKKDDVKISIQLSSWTWCTTASCNADGAYVDLTLAVKSKGAPQKKARDHSTGDADAYGLGFGTFLLSKKIKVDGGSWQNMTTGYPQLQTNGANQIFTFRFPRFNSSVIYDPTVSGDTTTSAIYDPTVSGDTTTGPTGGCGRVAASTALLFIIVTSVVKMLF